MDELQLLLLNFKSSKLDESGGLNFYKFYFNFGSCLLCFSSRCFLCLFSVKLGEFKCLNFTNAYLENSCKWHIERMNVEHDYRNLLTVRLCTIFISVLKMYEIKSCAQSYDRLTVFTVLLVSSRLKSA